MKNTFFQIINPLILFFVVSNHLLTFASEGLKIFQNSNYTSPTLLYSINNDDSVNIALIAEPSTSYVSSWETIDAVNDGYTPSNSNDKTHGAYGNWNNPNSYQWVQYDWDNIFIVKSIEIYWFDNGGGVLTPDTAYIQIDTAGNWVNDSIPVPCVKNRFNYAFIGDVHTSRIRVTMKNSIQSTGILEFRVWGTTESGSTDIQRPSIPGTPEIINKTDCSLTIQWSSSTDNSVLAGYHVILNDTTILTTPDTTAVVEDLIQDNLYLLLIKAVDSAGNYSEPSGSIWFSVGDEPNIGNEFFWPDYNPSLNYNFKNEYPSLPEPTKDLNDCPEVVGTQYDRWWTFKWGPNARSLVTEAAITPMLERMNKDFAYFRDTLGWPPDKRAKNGYRSAIYLYGSGLSCTDNADSTELGGWQSTIYYQNEAWPMVLLSYYPVYSFDPACKYSDKVSQMGAVVHEGIHSVLADLPGCKNAAWFHEGGNTWLQQEAYARQNHNYTSMGYLNGCTFLAPFMPIECYSGWLQDNSFGGPSAEGVNRYSGNTQICTWRNYLGGTQYGNSFPTFLGQALGSGSVAWIWRYCPDRVLEGMSHGLGDMQLRRLIIEYRAKQALLDMGEWSNAITSLLNSYFKTSIDAEWSPLWIDPETWIATPYAKTSYDSITKTLTPEYRTTPGWTGANQIPLNVTGTGDTVVVNFIPLAPNMTCQLCYRATDGTTVYSKPVSGGYCSITLVKKPANNVVIAVITNTDYIYKGEVTRKAHYQYQLQLIKGVYRKASIYKPWYDYNKTITDVIDPITMINEKARDEQLSEIVIYPNPSDGQINISTDNNRHDLNVFDINGKLVTSAVFNSYYQMELAKGVYLIHVKSEKKTHVVKLLVK